MSAQHIGFNDARSRAQRSICLKALPELEASGQIRSGGAGAAEPCNPRRLEEAVLEPVDVPDAVDQARDLELTLTGDGP